MVLGGCHGLPRQYVNQHKKTSSIIRCAKFEESEELIRNIETTHDPNVGHSGSRLNSGTFKPSSLSKHLKKSLAKMLAVPMTKFLIQFLILM